VTRRHASSVGPADPWSEALLAVGVLGGSGAIAGLVVWVSGAAASMVTGHGVGPSPVEAGRRMVDSGQLASVWPAVPMPVVLGVAIGVTASLSCAFAWAWLKWTARHPRRDGFAGASAFAELLPGRTGLAKARRLRPALDRRHLDGPDLGVPLGRLRRGGPLLRASWEDVVLAICAPRSGKTTCLAVPAVLDAPGPVIATSNKADLWTHTALLRGQDTGEQVWTFDPQRVTRGEQSFVWDALAGISTVADARRLAGHFIQEVRRTADQGDFWDRDAEDLLTGLLLAAALNRSPLSQVGTWLTSVSSVQPRNILAAAGFTQLADVMAGRSQGALETREGVYATARAAAASLSDPAIMQWVTPRAGLPVFDPAAFARSRQTLFLLSKDGAGSAAPLVAAFADRVLLEAVRAAESSAGGRLDPPMVAVLDEAANICRITELPRLYSHLGSRGVVPLTILQSRSQGRRVWGEGGMAELFGAATIKLIGAGVDEQGFADELSKMVGDEDVLVTSRSSGRSGGLSRTTRRERVLAADEVRALAKFTGLLLVTGVRPALLRLVPWMDGPRSIAIRAALKEHS
jgi:type IV secretory pathway TraG/TraD family ATPase VirD4